MRDYWFKQTTDKPLFPDLIWSRPEQSNHSGKLLIIGGNDHGFSAPAEAYSVAEDTGIGICRVLLPDSLQKSVGRILSSGEYAPSTPSGSFARSSLATFLEYNEWADGTLLAGDFGRNSETAVLLEQFLMKQRGHVTLTKDSVDNLLHSPRTILSREDTVLVVSFAQLQKLARNLQLTYAFTFDMDYLSIVDSLHDFSSNYNAAIIVRHLDDIFVAYNGDVSSTKISDKIKSWRVKRAAAAVVWKIQNSGKTFEALTCSLV